MGWVQRFIDKKVKEYTEPAITLEDGTVVDVEYKNYSRTEFSPPFRMAYRPDTSDEGVLKEVIDKHCYRRTRSMDFDVHYDELWLDLGANIGAFAAYCFSRGAGCFCVEPDPTSHAILKHNLSGMMTESIRSQIGDELARSTPKGSLRRAAVGQRSITEATLYHSSRDNDHYRSTLVPTKSMRPQNTVLCAHILDLTPDNLRWGNVKGVSATSWSGIKCDIEGGEFDILDHSHFPPCEKLVLEYHFSRDERNMSRFHRRMDRLRKQFHIQYPAELDREYPDGKFKGHFDRSVFCMAHRKP